LVARIIAVEGLDGSGKSTIVTLLAQSLGAVVIRNPPESFAAERWRADAFEPDARRRWYLRGNRVAMEEARAIAEAGTPVVLDRSVASTVCFGAAERAMIARREDVPADFPRPDFIVLLVLPEEIRRARRRSRGGEATSEETRLERDIDFRDRVLAGYRNVCSAVVDASGVPASVVSAILHLLNLSSGG
jgi:UMP-CMP kinase 2